mmetsp:Transcript_10316/g.15408  ORF Transcript_10316/g.15408 Transcript_10316/m.15408 type:complete len:369 (-) Transcript_10316:361-1467(-)
MGNCIAETDEDRHKRSMEIKRNKQLEKQLALEEKQGRLVHKLLLLGAGESGKSTFFKQLIRIHSKGYDVNSRKSFEKSIYKNIINAMHTLLHACDKLGCKLEAKTAEARSGFKKETENEDETQWIIDSTIGSYIKTLWNDSEVQSAYNGRDTKGQNFYVFDGAQYFFEKIDEIADDKWIPDEEDIVRCRIRTSGIIEKSFEIKGNRFRIFDVGGQRAERRKWIHCFQNVTAVMFIASLSCYNQTLFEDSSSNRMTEAILLFEDISNSAWFEETAIILFLNKHDLFKEKVESVPITECPSLQDFKGSGYTESLGYIQMVFEQSCQNPAQCIYTHVTTATSKSNVESIFESVQDIVIRKSMAEAGLLVHT